ncbi:MAG: hypothetical protein ACRDY2_06860 [Acidimicrobiales bacterium]
MPPSTSGALDPAWGVVASREHRWPATLAVAAAVALTVALPDPLFLGPRWVLPAVEAALAAPLLVVSPFRHRDEPPVTRWMSLALIGLAEVANLISLSLLVQAIINGSNIGGHQLILAAVEIYLTNVLLFGLWFWELDRGGPGARMCIDHREPDFLFPQMVTPDSAPKAWNPNFVDYLYVAFTNATAFSPTDTMPLTRAAKTLMTLESAAALLTVTLVAARAVNILK